MTKRLISMLERKIKYYEEEIKEMNQNIRYLSPTYKQLVPKKRKKGVVNFYQMDNNGLDLLMEVLMYNNKVLYKKISKLDQEEYKLNIMSKSLYYDRNSNTSSIHQTLSSTSYEKKEDQFYEKAKEIFIHACTYYVDLYEAIEKEKEETKSITKDYEYALKNIGSDIPLTTRNISSITNLINETISTKEEKQLLFDELNDYIKNTKKEKIINVPNKEEISEKEVRYIDEVKETDLTYDEETEDKYTYNYLITLKSFDSFNDVNSFLNSIKYTCDIYKVIDNVISLLSDSNEDNLLKLYLEKYIFSIKEDDEAEEKVCQETQENIDNSVLYYGFHDCKNNILNDIEKSDIPREYYDDIIELINMIKTGNDKGKCKRINSIKKVLKLRYKDIRITYKKLSNNVVIILGIFCKKDNKGYGIIDVTRKRNKELMKYEKNIIESVDIPELWDEYLKENNNIEEEIISTLTSYIK